MLSLVAYGSSGESDSEVESDDKKSSPATDVVKETSVNHTVPKSTASVVAGVSPISSTSGTEVEDNPSKSSLHSKLPPPKNGVIADADEERAGTSSSIGLLSKLPVPKQHTTSSLNSFLKEEKSGVRKGPVKILIPALSDFPDEDEPRPKKKIQPSSKGSGLFALLPPPQQTSVKVANRSLVPNVVSRKPKPPVSLQRPLKVTSKAAAAKKKNDSDSESDGESADADFFSLNKEDDLPSIPVETSMMAAENVLQNTDKSDDGPQHYQQQEFQQFDNTQLVCESQTEHQPNSDQDFVPFTVENLELDDEALRQLCGRQGKRRREEVQIVDVSGDAIMPDQREWLTKQLTEEQPRPSSSKSKLFGPSSQQRRKHQITYLAHVAKENELELKNSWANNRQTRKQTQSKYGF